MRPAVCAQCFSLCMCEQITATAADTHTDTDTEGERGGEREADKVEQETDQTWAQVTHRGSPVSMATCRCKTLGANLPLRSAEAKHLHAYHSAGRLTQAHTQYICNIHPYMGNITVG